MMKPRKILLATDLSGRADRAMDRATQLAAEWQAELVVVHALEKGLAPSAASHGLPSWRRAPEDSAAIEAQIRDDIRGDCPSLTVHVVEGDAVDVILATAEREQCGLIVVGLGRNRLFGWPPVGKTVDELFRRSPVSVLVVKRRPRGPYRHVLVGTDFTEEAKAGLEVAAGLFDRATFALMHAFELPYRSLLTDTQLSRDFSAMERATIQTFAEEAQLPDDVRQGLVTLIEHGPPEAMMSAYVAEHGADLTVIGAYERSRLFHAIVGGKGPGILEATPSDVLAVRARRD